MRPQDYAQSATARGLLTVPAATGRNCHQAPIATTARAALSPAIRMDVVDVGTHLGVFRVGAERGRPEKGEADEAWKRASGADTSGGYAGTSRDGLADSGGQDASATKTRILAGIEHWLSPERRAAAADKGSRALSTRKLPPEAGQSA